MFVKQRSFTLSIPERIAAYMRDSKGFIIEIRPIFTKVKNLAALTFWKGTLRTTGKISSLTTREKMSLILKQYFLVKKLSSFFY